MKWIPILAVGMLLIGSGSLRAADDSYGEGNARVRLVKSGEQPVADSSLYLGVEFDIKPGWHVYWKNPGGAGLATEIQWKLPEGVEAGDLQWPLPIGFTQSGEIPGYGYEESVVLASDLRATATITENAIIGASVSWLACKDVCVLGSADLESTWAEVPVFSGFSRWPESLPAELDQSSPPFTMKVTGSLSEGKIAMWLQWQTAPETIEWFPNPPDGLEVNSVTIRTRAGLTRIDVAVRNLAGSVATHDTLDSLVVVTDDQQERHGWQLAVDLRESDK